LSSFEGLIKPKKTPGIAFLEEHFGLAQQKRLVQAVKVHPGQGELFLNEAEELSP